MNIKQHILDFVRKDFFGLEPQTAIYLPDKDAIPQQCFRNVKEKVERCGGSKVYGWELIACNGIIQAIHHCVWTKDDGILIDITPVRGILMPRGNKICFIIDPNALPLLPPGYNWGVPLPSRYWIYNSKGARFASKLLQEERRYTKELENRFSTSFLRSKK